MYITSDFDKHIVFFRCAHSLVNLQQTCMLPKEIRIKYMKKKTLMKCCGLEALLFLRVQCVEEHRRVESAFTLKLTTRNSDDANGYSQIGSAQ